MLPENISGGISISAAQTLNLGFTEYSGSKHKKDVDEKKTVKILWELTMFFGTKLQSSQTKVFSFLFLKTFHFIVLSSSPSIC